MDCSNCINNLPVGFAVVSEQHQDLVQQLPEEISLNIFSFLKTRELAKCRRINSACCRLASDDSLLWSKKL